MSLKRTLSAIKLLLLAFVSVATVALAQEPSHAQTTKDVWEFRPDAETAPGNRLLDLRFLNEKQSGETGFVQLSEDGNSFVRGDGKPIRFWAVGSDMYRRPGGTNGVSKEELAKQWQARVEGHCRFLSRLGVNMVRLHATVANTKAGAEITDVNRDEIEGIYRFIKAAKDNGIYVTISPYYGHHATPESWKLEGYTGTQPWGALFVDPRMQEGYKAWTRELYTTKNPFTGLAIKDDPTVAILQVHNEDSLFFWTAQRLPEPQQQRLRKAFGDWLIKKYGSLEVAVKAWDGKKEDGDNLETGEMATYPIWNLTQDWKGGVEKRVRDYTQFLAEFQRSFYAAMGDYYRDELGCKQLLNATNWRTANDLKLKEIERWTYAALDIDAENEYYGSDYQHIGENNGYRIDPGHYLVNESVLHKPLELTANFKSHLGHPFIVTETSWKHPNLYQSEGPFLIAAYQSLGGVDAVFWFSANDETWLEDPRRLFWKVGDSYAIDKWSCSTPMLMGMFPAAAITYRQGYLQEGKPVILETRSLTSLFSRTPPEIDDNEIYGVSRETEECKKSRREDGRFSRAAFLVGPVQMKLEDPDHPLHMEAVGVTVAPFEKYLKYEDLILSNTGQLKWNYEAGLCTMDAPQAQGVTGFLKAAGKFTLTDVTIESSNDYASISVVSLDGKPLAESSRVLVQAGTTARLKDWKTKPAEFEFQKGTMKGEQIVNTGKPPWQIVATHATVTLANAKLKHAHQVTIAGRDGGEIPLKQDGKGCTLVLPSDAMYVVLTSEQE